MSGSIDRQGPLRRALPRLAFESILIVFSILAALAVAEWREVREERRQVAEALANFRREIEHNRDEVSAALAYHRAALSRMQATAEDGQAPQSGLGWLGEFLPEGLRPPDVRSTAWNTAEAQGVLLHMAYDQVYLLAGLYGAQETGVAATVVRIVEGLIRPESLDPDAGERLRGFLVLGLGELAGQEEYLLERYATILAELE